MKRNTLFLIVVLSIFWSVPTNAQFLKNLGKKVVNATEKSIEKKAEQKTTQTVDNSMDGIFNSVSSDKKDNKNDSPSTSDKKPNKNYFFDYLYQLEVQSAENETELNFFINQKENYIGMAMSQGEYNIFSVIDYPQKASYTFMGANNQNFYIYNALDNELLDFEDDLGPAAGNHNYTITDLPDKTFLGYNCKGKLIEDKEQKTTIYYTTEASIDMNQIFNSQQQSEDTGIFDSGMYKAISEMSKGTIMYIETENKKNKKENFKMTCTQLKKVNQNFDTSNYSSIGY